MHAYRPGIRALRELGITSPWRTCTSPRPRSRSWPPGGGISVASRPSTPCMATRIPYNTPIDYDMLRRIGEGEAYLRTLVGGNVRLRLHGDIARIKGDVAIKQKMGGKNRGEGRPREMGDCYITP